MVWLSHGNNECVCVCVCENTWIRQNKTVQLVSKLVHFVVCVSLLGYCCWASLALDIELANRWSTPSYKRTNERQYQSLIARSTLLACERSVQIIRNTNESHWFDQYVVKCIDIYLKPWTSLTPMDFQKLETPIYFHWIQKFKWMRSIRWNPSTLSISTLI